MRDILTEIIATARRNRLRTALTGFAVAWGIFMLVFLLGAGNGLLNSMRRNSEFFLVNSMMVYGGSTSKPYAGYREGRSVILDARDMELTATTFPDKVDEVGAVWTAATSTVSLGGNYLENQTMKGVMPNDFAINNRKLTSGRFINRFDIDQSRKVAVVSDDQAVELTGGKGSLLGKWIKADGILYKVVGTLKSDANSTNSEVFAPATTLRTIYGLGSRTNMLEFSFHGLETVEQNEAFNGQYRSHLNLAHDAAPSDENSVWLWNRKLTTLQMGKAIGMVQSALWIVGLFTLLSGVVGVSNIMLISVKERTREFGIRKAIGASPWSVLKLIIVESVIVTTLFGYVGMFFGVLANEYMDAAFGNSTVETGLFAHTMFVDPTVGIDVCINATLVLIVAGTMAGLLPAIRAARIRPIEALRAE